MASKKQLKRRNHTVNKSYLRRFANGDGQLMQVELPGDKRVLVSITDATVYKNFYLLRLPDGTETDAAEDAFSVVESAATEAIRSLVDHGTWPIPSRVRQDIAGWAALQYLRGPWVRQLGREIAEGFSGAGVPIRTGGGEQITVSMSADGIDELTGPRLQLELIRRQLPEVAAMLCERDWILTFTGSRDWLPPILRSCCAPLLTIRHFWESALRMLARYTCRWTGVLACRWDPKARATFGCPEWQRLRRT